MKDFSMNVLYRGQKYSLRCFDRETLEYAQKTRPNEEVWIFTEKDGLRVKFKELKKLEKAKTSQ